MGDEAILFSEVQLLSRYQEKIQLIIPSFDPPATKKMLESFAGNIQSIFRLGSKTKFFRTEFGRLFRAYQNVDLVLIGGGGMLQDAYNWYTIPYFSFYALLGKLFGKPTLFYNVGVGPINYKFSQRFLSVLGRCLDRFIVRDLFSKSELEDCGVPSNKIKVGADPVFALPVALPGGSKKFLINTSLHDKLLGIAVREVAHWRDLDYGRLARLFDNVANYLDAKVIFLPFGNYTNQFLGSKVTEPRDLAVSQKIADLMRTKSFVVDTHNVEPREMLSAIRQLDFFVGMRLHSLIMAAASSVPFIALGHAQDSKLLYLIKNLGLSEEWFVKVNSLENKFFLSVVKNLEDQYADVKKQLLKKSLRLAKRAKFYADLENIVPNKKSCLSVFDVVLFLAIAIFGFFHLGILSLIQGTRTPD